MSFCVAGGFMFAVSSLTSGDEQYTLKYFTDGSVTSALSEELYDGFDKIADGYSFDGDVLKNAYPQSYLSSVQETVLHSLFIGRTSPVSVSVNVSSRCVGALEEYNNAQSKKDRLSDKDIDKITKQVSETFDSIYSIVNVAEFGAFTSFFSRSVKLTVLFFAAAFVLFFMIYMISGRRHNSFNYIAMAIETAGGIMIGVPIVLIRRLSVADYTPTNVEAYNSAMVAESTNIYHIIISIGAILIIIGASIFISNYRYYSAKLKKYAADYEIEQNLI